MQKSKKSVQPIDYSHKILTVPNILSLLRIALIPLLCVLYFAKKDGLAAGILLGVSALTDVIDGFIARRFNMISNFGKELDPVADKMTQGVVLICLLTRFPYLAVVVALLIIKEVTTGAVNLHIAKKTGIVNGAEWHGKLTTVVLFLLMFVHLVWFEITPTVSYIMAAFCLAVMLFSFVLYGVKNHKLLKNHKD